MFSGGIKLLELYLTDPMIVNKNISHSKNTWIPACNEEVKFLAKQ